MSKQRERIEKMEAYLDEIRETIDAFDEALEAYEKVQKKLARLEKYYTGPSWIKDFEDYEKGKFPEDLKCGVLSEDAVYDVLTDKQDLMERMRKLTGSAGN